MLANRTTAENKGGPPSIFSLIAPANPVDTHIRSLNVVFQFRRPSRAGAVLRSFPHFLSQPQVTCQPCSSTIWLGVSQPEHFSKHVAQPSITRSGPARTRDSTNCMPLRRRTPQLNHRASEHVTARPWRHQAAGQQTRERILLNQCGRRSLSCTRRSLDDRARHLRQLPLHLEMSGRAYVTFEKSHP